MITQEIKKVLKEAAGVEGLTVELSIPSDSSHGDYTSNIALIASKKLEKKPPRSCRDD